MRRPATAAARGPPPRPGSHAPGPRSRRIAAAAAPEAGGRGLGDGRRAGGRQPRRPGPPPRQPRSRRGARRCSSSTPRRSGPGAGRGKAAAGGSREPLSKNASEGRQAPPPLIPPPPRRSGLGAGRPLRLAKIARSVLGKGPSLWYGKATQVQAVDSRRNVREVDRKPTPLGEIPLGQITA